MQYNGNGRILHPSHSSIEQSYWTNSFEYTMWCSGEPHELYVILYCYHTQYHILWCGTYKTIFYGLLEYEGCMTRNCSRACLCIATSIATTIATPSLYSMSNKPLNTYSHNNRAIIQLHFYYVYCCKVFAQ